MGCCDSREDAVVYASRRSKPHHVENATNSTRVDTTLRLDSRVFIKRVKGQLSSFYNIQGELGSGTYGTVKACTHKKSGLMRAVKSLRKSEVERPNADQMFSEFEVLRRLDHPNILRVNEVIEDESSYYIVTELCSGGELFERIISQHQFSENLAAKYFYQIMSALMYCHELNIVHRDIKPENILLVDKKVDSPVKIIDFGVSCMFKPGDTFTKRYGTVKNIQPYYIAPEVLRNQYTEKCDIWSAGVVLYVMLSEF